MLGFVAETGDAQTSATFSNAYADAFVRYLEELEGEQRSGVVTPLVEKVNEVTAELDSAFACPGPSRRLPRGPGQEGLGKGGE